MTSIAPPHVMLNEKLYIDSYVRSVDLNLAVIVKNRFARINMYSYLGRNPKFTCSQQIVSYCGMCFVFVKKLMKLQRKMEAIMTSWVPDESVFSFRLSGNYSICSIEKDISVRRPMD